MARPPVQGIGGGSATMQTSTNASTATGVPVHVALPSALATAFTNLLSTLSRHAGSTAVPASAAFLARALLPAVFLAAALIFAVAQAAWL